MILSFIYVSNNNLSKIIFSKNYNNSVIIKILYYCTENTKLRILILKLFKILVKNRCIF